MLANGYGKNLSFQEYFRVDNERCKWNNLTVNKENNIPKNQQNVVWKGENENCEKVNITLELLQHYFIVIDFLLSLKIGFKMRLLNLMSKCK